MGAVVRQKGETFAGFSAMETTLCTCGVLFAVPEKLLDTRRWDGESFYCPNGHSLSFKGDRFQQGERVRLAEEAASRALAARDQAEASARGQKAAATRARNQRDKDRQRIAAGVCPCCNRTFKNLAQHMQKQHPDFGPIGEHDEAEAPRG